MELVENIVSNSDRSRDFASKRGLPIGNLTSQFFANVYLDPFDHFVKDHLGVKCYIRYMDDTVIFSDSKSELKELLIRMKCQLSSDLNLSLHKTATRINNRSHGLPFLGFRIFPNLIRVKNENLNRTKKRMDRRKREFQEGVITEEQFVMSIRSMFEHVGFANSFHLRASVLVPRADVV